MASFHDMISDALQRGDNPALESINIQGVALGDFIFSMAIAHMALTSDPTPERLRLTLNAYAIAFENRLSAILTAYRAEYNAAR